MINARLFTLLAALFLLGLLQISLAESTDSMKNRIAIGERLVRAKRAPVHKLALLGGAALLGKKALLVGGTALGAKALLGAGAIGVGAGLGAGLYKAKYYGGGYGYGGPGYVEYPSYHNHYHQHYEPHLDYHVDYPHAHYPSHNGWDYGAGWY